MPPSESNYKPRPMTPERAALIEEQAKSQRESRGGWRERTLIDFSGCLHIQRLLMEVNNDHGMWMVEVCVDCGDQVARQCPHIHSTWNEKGTVLTCDNCGIDGT